MGAPSAIAYIDGFNFYHGAVKHRPELKWLDFPAMCDAILPDHEVIAVKYYTVLAPSRPSASTERS